MTTTLPAPPAPSRTGQQPQQPKKHWGRWVLLGLAVMFAVSIAQDLTEKQPTAVPVVVPEISVPPASTSGDQAKMAVDLVLAQNPGALESFCDSVNTLGEEASYQAFDSGYNQTTPTAREVFDELLSRCS